VFWLLVGCRIAQSKLDISSLMHALLCKQTTQQDQRHFGSRALACFRCCEWLTRICLFTSLAGKLSRIWYLAPLVLTVEVVCSSACIWV